MIRDTLNGKQVPAVTSDRWHVIRASWMGSSNDTPQFTRAIVSEHADSKDALRAAHDLNSALREEMTDRSLETRDQLLVRAPNHVSLKTAGRVIRRADK